MTQGDRVPEVRLDSSPRRTGGPAPAQLADVLERVLDKGIVVAGDIQINLLDIELLTVRIRLLIASADKAKEMGINWWEGDPFLRRSSGDGALEGRLRRLEEAAGLPTEEERSEK